ARLGEDLPPPLRGQRRLREDRGGEEPDRRHQPENADHGEHDLDRRVREHPQHAGGDPVAWGRDRDRRGSHQTSLLKRRTLSASTGITSRKRNTAIAEPTPKFWPP